VLADAMEQSAASIHSRDGVIEAAIAEAGQRLRALSTEHAALRLDLDAAITSLDEGILTPADAADYLRGVLEELRNQP